MGMARTTQDVPVLLPLPFDLSRKVARGAGMESFSYGRTRAS